MPVTDAQARIDAGMTVLRARFLKRLPGRLDEIRSALATCDAPADAASPHPAARLAHSLAGAAGTFGYDTLAGTARRLDAALRAPGTPPAALAEAFAALVASAGALQDLAGN
jgi:HPt (histidine-containing phosphotransfer) domain-containing protein